MTPKTQHCVSNISPSTTTNTLKHTHTGRHTDHSCCCPLWESSQLGFFSSCFVWAPFKMAPSWPCTLWSRQAAPEWTEAPWVQAVIHGTRVCKRAASPHAAALHGDKESRGCLAVGVNQKSGYRIEPCWDHAGQQRQKGQCFCVYVFARAPVCVCGVWCVCVCGESMSEIESDTKTWMGKLKLMLECVCWIYAAPYPGEDLAVAF